MVALRLYGSETAFFDQTWKPDDIVKVKQQDFAGHIASVADKAILDGTSFGEYARRRERPSAPALAMTSDEGTR